MVSSFKVYYSFETIYVSPNIHTWHQEFHGLFSKFCTLKNDSVMLMYTIVFVLVPPIFFSISQILIFVIFALQSGWYADISYKAVMHKSRNYTI